MTADTAPSRTARPRRSFLVDFLVTWATTLPLVLPTLYTVWRCLSEALDGGAAVEAALPRVAVAVAAVPLLALGGVMLALPFRDGRR